MTDHLSTLNPHQREAAETTAGPILILAGAGSGKTRVITHRIAHLMDIGIKPDNILAVTFTNKAAGEMKERVAGLLNGTGGNSPLVSTFHSLCVRMLRANFESLGIGYTRSFHIYDSNDQLRLMRHCIRDMGLDPKKTKPEIVHSEISAAKNRGIGTEQFLAIVGRDVSKDRDRQILHSHIYTLYEQRLRGANALDFDDLLLRAEQLLKRCPDVRKRYHERFRHVMVDEFQDTNGIQFSIVRLLVEGDLALSEGPTPDDFWRERSVCVVGDESQSIYGFRGSDFQIIMDFSKSFDGTKTVKLEDNYRSTGNILMAANEVIKNNSQRFDKVLRANHPQGEKVRDVELPHSDEEGIWTISTIKRHIEYNPKIKAAVLYRTNAQSRPFEDACRRAGIRYCLVGGIGFYERAEIKDIVAYLNLALRQDDPLPLLRVINVPARGIGKTSIDKVEAQARAVGVSLWEMIGRIIAQNALPARTISGLQAFRETVQGLTTLAANTEVRPSVIVKAAIENTGYLKMLQDEHTEEADARIENLGELVNAAVEAEERGEDLVDLLDQAALVADTDDLKDAPVTLMTVHASKGLEFPLVFVAGMEEGLFPHARSQESRFQLEEERRLFYVALTRAERYLYLTHAVRRRIYGINHSNPPSQFLMELPEDVTERR